MAYQTHSDESIGDSNSKEKLERLGFPLDLTGKSFLDLGCNEGFFCGLALSRGASIAIGIDSNPDAIKVATGYYPNADFRTHDWLETRESNIDLILLSSALHYSGRPIEVLKKVSDMLDANGLFILEAGAISDQGTHLSGMKIGRSAGSCGFPTIESLEAMLENAGFVFRLVGPSVYQSGDPVDRWVWHCTKQKPHIIIVKGESGSGKSTLSRTFSKLNPSLVAVVSTDSMIGHLTNQKLHHYLASFSPSLSQAMSTVIEQVVGGQVENSWEYISQISDYLLSQGFVEELLEQIMCQISFCVSEIILIEGELLTREELTQSLTLQLNELGYMVSTIESGMGKIHKKRNQVMNF